MEQDIKDTPGVVLPPPLIFAALLAAGLLLHRAFPVHFLPHAQAVRLLTGLPLLGISGILALWSFQVMRQSNTSVDCNKPTTKIVVNGPFRFTRNPLYVSLLLLYAGIAILVNTLWCILLLPVLFVIFNRGVVNREEKYLEQKFGEEYLQYKKRVRRWI